MAAWRRSLDGAAVAVSGTVGEAWAGELQQASLRAVSGCGLEESWVISEVGDSGSSLELAVSQLSSLPNRATLPGREIVTAFMKEFHKCPARCRR